MADFAKGCKKLEITFFSLSVRSVALVSKADELTDSSIGMSIKVSRRRFEDLGCSIMVNTLDKIPRDSETA